MLSLDRQVLDETRNYNFEIDGQKVKYNSTPKYFAPTPQRVT